MRSAYDEVYVYTMGRPGFILQYVVDAHAAQIANGTSKPIRIVFALVGLYLHVERHFSGHQVQQAHMELGRRKRAWPIVDLPNDRGAMTVADVLAAPAGWRGTRRLSVVRMRVDGVRCEPSSYCESAAGVPDRFVLTPKSLPIAEAADG